MPKPKVQVLVCVNERPAEATKPCCAPKDALAVYRKFKDGIRARGIREDVMVVRTGCLKHCSQGLAVNIWPQNFWLRNVTPADVDEILDRAVVDGEEVERLAMPDIPWE